MINVNLVDFVTVGRFPPFSLQSTRAEIIGELGPADEPSYSGHLVYGNVCFDMHGLDGPLSQMQILFPHESNFWRLDTTSGQMRSVRHVPLWSENWPDARFAWNLGALVPGITLAEALQTFSRSKLLDWRPSNHELELYSFPESNVRMEFESSPEAGAKTLSRIIGLRV